MKGWLNMPACVKCGRRHSGRYGEKSGGLDWLHDALHATWHRCSGCKSVYCEDCAKSFDQAAGISESRICPRCGNDTETFQEER